MNNNHKKYRCNVLLLLLILFSGGLQAQSLIVESSSGPLSVNELKAFKHFIRKYEPDPGKMGGNIWVFGHAGKAIEACGLMFEASADTSILNRMISLCDRALSSRNDIAPAAIGGQLKVWTGKVEAIWPSDKIRKEPASAGIEQGAVVGHMAYCARLILQNPALWDKKVSIGDQHDFGATYKERALTFILEGDYVMDNWVLKHFVRAEDHNRLYFPGPPNTYKPNGPAPWNQLFMVTNGLIRLTECHLLLNDDQERIKKYDAIVQPNLNWFFSSLRPKTSKAGTPVYEWDYALDQRREDANHFAYDAEGLWIAYHSGRYGIRYEDLVPFANTYTDVILAIVQPNGKYAGMVDGASKTGNSGGYNFVRDEYFYLADFRPDQFDRMVEINRKAGKIADFLPGTARLLWQKYRRNNGNK